METEESRLNSEIEAKVVQIYSHFMARKKEEEWRNILVIRKWCRLRLNPFRRRVAKFEELAAAGNRFLVSFRQALEFIQRPSIDKTSELEFIRRPSIDKTSELFEKVIKTNETDRIHSYIKAGCAHASSKADNLNKLHMTHIQLLNDISKAKDIINELECLVEDVKLALEAPSETLQDPCPDLDPLAANSNYSEEGMEKPQVVDYTTMIAAVYSMVKKDYVMQEKIVSSLNLKTSSGEVESYCLMWLLRPFVNDELMHQAWRLVS